MPNIKRPIIFEQQSNYNNKIEMKKCPNFIRTIDRHRMTKCSGQSKREEQEKIMD